MNYVIIKGKLGAFFYQGCKGGKVQRKSRFISWNKIHNPSAKQLKCRQLFRDAVNGKKFDSQKEMFQAIKNSMKEL